MNAAARYLTTLEASASTASLPDSVHIYIYLDRLFELEVIVPLPQDYGISVDLRSVHLQFSLSCSSSSESRASSRSNAMSSSRSRPGSGVASREGPAPGVSRGTWCAGVAGRVWPSWAPASSGVGKVGIWCLGVKKVEMQGIQASMATSARLGEGDLPRHSLVRVLRLLSPLPLILTRPIKTAMSELFKDIPEFVEVSMPLARHPLTRRPTSERALQPERKPLVRLACPVHPDRCLTFSAGSFRELGPPDLCHVMKVYGKPPTQREVNCIWIGIS